MTDPSSTQAARAYFKELSEGGVVDYGETSDFIKQAFLAGVEWARAVECNEMQAQLVALAKHYERHDDCVEAKYRCDYRVTADCDKCPCEIRDDVLTKWKGGGGK